MPELPADAAELGRRMARDHQEIIRRAAGLDSDPAAHELGELLSRHVRFEERELFPLIEARLSSNRLGDIARRLEGPSHEG